MGRRNRRQSNMERVEMAKVKIWTGKEGEDDKEG